MIIVGQEAIAEHLGVGIKMIRKWIKEDGLPIRILGDGIHRVDSEELRQWFLDHPKLIEAGRADP